LQGKAPLASGCLALFFVGRHERQTTSSVDQLTPLAFVAASDDPSRIRRSRDIGAYLGLVTTNRTRASGG
jgi:transposase